MSEINEKMLPFRPNITFSTFWQMLGENLYVSAVLGALAWMWAAQLNFCCPKMIGALIASGWFFLICWNWWAWRSRRKNSRGHRWLAGFTYLLYMSGYFWVAGVSYWWRRLMRPWDSIVVGLLFGLWIVVLALPAFYFDLAKKLYTLHRSMDLKLLGCGGIGLIGLAGITGYWLSKALVEENDWMTVVAILGPIVGLGLLQYHLVEMWFYRPWKRE